MVEFKIGDKVNITPDSESAFVYLNGLNNLEIRDGIDEDGEYEVWESDKSDYHFVKPNEMTLAGDPNDAEVDPNG